MYYCNYLAPVKFTVPSSLSASRDTQSLLPGLGSLMSDGLNLGDGVSLTTGDTASQDGLEMIPVTIPGTPADLSGKFADKFSSKTVATANSYQSKDLAVTVTQHSYGTGNDEVSYYNEEARKLNQEAPNVKLWVPMCVTGSTGCLGFEGKATGFPFAESLCQQAMRAGDFSLSDYAALPALDTTAQHLRRKQAGNPHAAKEEPASRHATSRSV